MKIKTKNILRYFLSFSFGLLLMFLFNLSWVRNVQISSNQYIIKQQELVSNYSESFDLLANCLLIKKDQCDIAESTRMFEELKKERDLIKIHLLKMNPH